jgi:hypothetical protein
MPQGDGGINLSCPAAAVTTVINLFVKFSLLGYTAV